MLFLGSSEACAGVVLLYHHVDTDTPAITSIPPEQFERHLEIITEEGYTVRPLHELVSRSLADTEPRAKDVAITFDDAYTSIYRTAFPMLKARGWPFTIFVATDFVSDTNPHYLSWKQLREMADHGAAIENHTMSHAHLLRQKSDENHDTWRSRIRAEITGAGRVLEEQGYESTLFAYPYGEYDLAMLDMVSDLGLTGFGQQSGAIGPGSHPGLLPRYPLAGVYAGEAAFRDKLRSLGMPHSYQEPEPLLSGNFKPAMTLTLDDATSPDRMTCYGPGGLMDLSIEGNRVTAIPKQEVSVGRSRYNCTLPAGKGRFYWFSQLWIRKRSDGSWYPEP